jgi:hypothetical protein
MSSQILVGNQVGTLGEISLIEDDNVLWTHNETLTAWLVKFPDRDISEYHRNFTLIKVTDRTKAQLLYLGEAVVIDENPITNRWFFVEPDKTSEQWQELFITGEVSKTFAEIEPYLREFS